MVWIWKGEEETMIALWQNATPVEMAPGITRRTLGVGEKVLMVEFRLLAGSAVKIHSHPYEQVGYVVSGQMAFNIDGEEQVLELGDSYVAPAGTPHGARCLADAVLAEVFAPPRDDYRV
jgi:quercetin dioxygenase-like cupin family protein